MATNTPNYDLIKPAYADAADIADINGNMDIIDDAMNDNAEAITTVDGHVSTIQGGLAIVSDNNTHAAITSGQYVYVRGHSTLSEGLYTANSNIAANATLSSSNLTSASGALNVLNSKTTPSAITTTAASGFTKRTPCRAKKIGSLVTLFLDVIASSAITIGSTYTKVLTFSTDYNSNGDVFGVVYVNGKDILACNVYNGEVQVRSINNSVSLSSSDIIRGSISWVVGE